MNKQNKVGRPNKYQSEELRKEVRKQQNRINQQRRRRRIKLLQDIELFSNGNLSDGYRNTLANYINQYDFDYFFTGTVDPNKSQSQQLAQLNEDIKKLNAEHNLDIPLAGKKRIGINGLKNYTERYLNHLCEKQLMSRCFVVFEQDAKKQYHVHILFKSNPKVYNFRCLTENKWLLGYANCNLLETKKDKLNAINYMVKQMNSYASKKSDVNKIDNWFCDGEFEVEEEAVFD